MIERGPHVLASVLAGVLAACAAHQPPAPLAEPGGASVSPDHSTVAVPRASEPLLPPLAAMRLGLLPRRTTGAEQFVSAHPDDDGRGVLIGILDSGIDAGLPGLQRTTTGDTKLVDLRDFSGEGRITLERVVPGADTVRIGGRRLVGVGRIGRLALPPYYGGLLVEATLGLPPAADVNGDGDATDSLPLVVARASDGWFVMADSDGDGSLANEVPVRDFARSPDTFAFGPLTLAANLATDGERPVLDLFFDTSGHGSHVAGIAAGHDLFGVLGFDGIAPGAQLLGLKIANDARGGVSVSGSMMAAMEYAARFAERSGRPLVLNLSYGVGNQEAAGRPLIDSLIDRFALEHPDVAIVISAGNDGPGVSTVGFPGSAELALSACALFPGVFAQAARPDTRPPDDVVGWWSGRGGEVRKPDLCVPGVAFSNVPPWDVGQEVGGGTSMAAPHLSGIVALLQSAMVREAGTAAGARAVGAALRATAAPIPGTTTLDAGAGIPNVAAAWQWLRAGHRAEWFTVRSLPDGGNASWGTAAYRRNGLASPGDTIQRFTVNALGDVAGGRVLLRSDAAWLRAPDAMPVGGAPATVPVTYDASLLRAPGLYVGTVWGRVAADTLAGAAFGLANTIVVPEVLDTPFATRETLRAGRSARHFFRVPAQAGGMSLRVRVLDREQHATVYLFEPSGQPQRERASAEVGGDLPDSADLGVRLEDLEPGVYEAVVVAPPTAGTSVRIEAALPPVRIESASPDGVTLASGVPSEVRAIVAADLLGTARSFALAGRGTVTCRAAVVAPDWAADAMLEVRVDPALWPRITDFAVTVWDSTGRLVAESAIDYPTDRHYLPLDSLRVHDLIVELIPAFALIDDSTAWTASVTVAFLRSHPIRLGQLAADVAPGGATRVPWSLTLEAADPVGFLPYVEVSARVGTEAPAIRRLALEPPADRRGGGH